MPPPASAPGRGVGGGDGRLVHILFYRSCFQCIYTFAFMRCKTMYTQGHLNVLFSGEEGEISAYWPSPDIRLPLPDISTIPGESISF